MTNYERLKTMTVSEMAEALAEINGDRFDYPCEHCEGDCRGQCAPAIEGWLRAPVEDWMKPKA